MKSSIRTSIFMLLTALLFAFTTAAQQEQLEKSLLWKIEKEGYKTAYLFGTIHLLSEEKFIIPENVQKAFDKSDNLMLEINVTDANQMVAMMDLAVMANGVLMKDLLSDEDYANLDTAIMMQEGMGLDVYGNFKPFVLESMLLFEVIEGTPASYEMELAKMAQAKYKDIYQLESVEDQMAVFDAIPYEDQAKDLMRYVYSDEDMKAQFNQMVDVYLNQDIEQLHTMMDDYYIDKVWLDKLLVERNKKWVPKIEKLTKKKSMFIAVGAGHLAGETGLINLFRQNEFEVTAVLK